MPSMLEKVAVGLALATTFALLLGNWLYKFKVIKDPLPLEVHMAASLVAFLSVSALLGPPILRKLLPILRPGEKPTPLSV